MVNSVAENPIAHVEEFPLLKLSDTKRVCTRVWPCCNWLPAIAHTTALPGQTWPPPHCTVLPGRDFPSIFLLRVVGVKRPRVVVDAGARAAVAIDTGDAARDGAGAVVATAARGTGGAPGGGNGSAGLSAPAASTRYGETNREVLHTWC